MAKRLPLIALIILPALAGVALIGVVSWRLFTASAELSSQVASVVIEEMIKTMDTEALSDPLADGDTASLARIVASMASSALVFAVSLEDAEGNLIARAQNPNLLVEDGVLLIHHTETLSIRAWKDERTSGRADGVIVLGEVRYQLTPYGLAQEVDRVVSQYQLLIVALLSLGFLVTAIAARILLTPTRVITKGLQRLNNGETHVSVDTPQLIAEFETIRGGVNRLSRHVDDARIEQAQALADVEAALDKAHANEEETQILHATAAREIAEPVRHLVEQLRLQRASAELAPDTASTLQTAENIQLSLSAMLGRLDKTGHDQGEHALDAFFERVEQRYRPRFDIKRLGFHVASRGAPGASTWAFDARALDGVLDKLLDNARTFTPQGEVRLLWDVSSPHDTGAILTITVRDNGTGIAPDHVPHIFERYASFAQSERGGGGSGLGLYIAKVVTEQQGGDVSVVSQPGVGSEFTVRIPVKPVDTQMTSWDMGGAMALVVGAPEADQDLLETYFAAQEVVDMHCDTGIEALTLLAEHPIDVMLVDECLSDIEVETCIRQAKMRCPSISIAVLCDALTDFTGADLGITRPLTERSLNAGFGELRSQASRRVDYRLRDRFRSTPGSNAD